MPKLEWQHVVPQRDCDHDIKPTGYDYGGTKSAKYFCLWCRSEIRIARKNEGPEALKAMFPL